MIFISDHVYIEKDNVLYSTGSLNDTIIERYERMLGDVLIVGYKRKYEPSFEKYIKDGNVAKKARFELFSKSNNPLKIKKLFDSKVAPLLSNNGPVVIRMSILGLFAAKYCRKHNINYLIEVVASTWDSLWYHSLKGKIAALFITPITKREIKKAPNVIYVTNSFLQKHYPTRGESIGCSDVELSREKYNLEDRIFHNESIDLHNLSICTVANVEVKYKGQKLVLKAMKALRKKGFLVKYYLAGPGNQNRLKKIAKKYKISDWVYFLGPLTHAEVFDLMKKVDIYIQPSYQEGLPRAVIEAMSLGLPCFGSTAGGTYELLDEKCVFKKGDWKEIARLLESITKEEINKLSSLNYNRSLLYDKDLLDKKRKDFYLTSFSGNCNE